MFTIDQIKDAHSKVKSGADFPAFIRDIRKLGVTHYETFVADGHSEYFGANSYGITSAGKYEPLPIDRISNPEEFKADLKAHQQGKTDYPKFCRDSAKSGIEKWVVRMDVMTCAYYDVAGNEVLVERIPK